MRFLAPAPTASAKSARMSSNISLQTALLTFHTVRPRAGQPCRDTTSTLPDLGRAARQLQLNVAPISNGKAADLLKRLPQGRIHANGRHFLPSVRKDLYERVVAFAGTAQQQDHDPADRGASASNGNGGSGELSSGGASSPSAFPASWEEIVVGHLVIAQEAVSIGVPCESKSVARKFFFCRRRSAQISGSSVGPSAP